MKSNRKYISSILAGLFCLALNILSAQTSVVHFNKPSYLTGEVAWYKVFLPENFLGKEYSVQLKLVGPDGLVKDRYFLKSNEENYIAGYYKFPYNIQSGTYHFQYYLADAIGFTEHLLCEFPVSVVNDIQLTDPAVVTMLSRTESQLPDDLMIRISLASGGVKGRSLLPVRVEVSDKNGNPVTASLSVSISQEGLSEFGNTERICSYAGPAPGNFGTQLYARGKVTNDAGEGLRTNVMGAYSSEDGEMFYTKSDKSGEYILKLPDFEGKKPVQLISYLFNEHDKIRVDVSESCTTSGIQGQAASSSFIDYVLTGKDRKKIYQSFNATEVKLNAATIKRQLKKRKPNSRFVFNEYKRFDNLAAFFNELLNSNLEFLKDKDGEYTARMYNPQARGLVRHFEGAPIFIIDGKITRDANFVAQMSQDNLESGELYFISKDIREQFGTFGSSAIVILHTKLPNVSIPAEDADDIITVHGLQPKAIYNSISQEDIQGAVPLFRDDIYWNPDLKTSPEGKIQFNVLQGDDVANYRIRVLARDSEGRVGLGEKLYPVVSDLK